MKLKINMVMLVIIAIVYSFINSSNIYAEEKIFELSYDDFKPFHWLDKTDMKAKGIFIDICEEIINKRLGYKIEYYEYPWKRAQMMVKNGVHDAFITIPTPERLAYAEPSKETFIFMTKKMFTGSNNPRLDELRKVQKIEDLKGFSLLGYAGDGWGKEKIEKEAGLKLFMVSSIPSILRMLSLNRGDAFIASPYIVNYELKNLVLSKNVIELPATIEKVAYKLFVEKESAFREQLPNIDKILAEIKADGTMEEIINRWR